MVRFFLAVGAFLVFIPSAHSQYEYDPNCRDAYQAVFSLRFAEARRLIDLEKKQEPANLIPLYLENCIDFLTLFIGEDRRTYDLLKDRKSERVSLLEQGRDNSPYHRFCLAEIHIQWAFSRLKFGDYTAAAFEIRKAHALLAGNEVLYPEFTLNKLGSGMVHVVVGLVPENYHWIAGIMGLDGSVEEGLAEIREVAMYNGSDPVTRLYRPEAAFYLGFLTVNLQKDKREALPLLSLMDREDASASTVKSPLLIYARAMILSRNGRNDQALEVLKERNSLQGRFPFFYLDYLEGMARLNKLDFSAEACFERFVSGFRGKNYIASACQKMAWIALLQGDTVRYTAKIQKIGTTAGSSTDEDRQARHEEELGLVPNVHLLKARLLFDGGYYTKARDLLLGQSIQTFITTKRDLVEYHYRLARIYQETGNTVKALEYFGKTVRLGRNEPVYFAASAAYQSGLILENSGEWAKADSAYRLCLSINTPEYKTSLSQKARAGLSRVKGKVPKT